MARGFVTEEVFEEIIRRRFIYRQTCEQIAGPLGLKEKSVSNYYNIFMLMRDKAYDKLADKISKDIGYSGKAIKMAAKKLGVEVPAIIVDALNKRDEKREEYRAKQRKEEAPIEQIAEEVEKTPEKPKTAEYNEALFLGKIINLLVEQNELLTQLMDTVMPHWAADIKDNINANADTIGVTLVNCEKSLDAIRCNSRKRGL